MATILDVGFMQNFTRLFVFLFALFAVYGFMSKLAFFGEKKNGLNGLIALMAAIFVAMSTPVVAIGTILIPVIVTVFIIILTFAIVYQTFNGEGEKLPKMSKEGKWLFIMLAVIIVASIVFYVFNTTTGIDEAGNPYKKNTTTIQKNESQLDVNYDTGVFNSKIMGLIMVLVIGAFAVRLLSGDNK